MTAGTPTSPHQQATTRQADRILAMLTAGTPLETVVTAGVREGWTRARVQAVIRDHGLPLDAAGRLTGATPPPVPTDPRALLAYVDRIDDPRMRGQAAHIRADIALLLKDAIAHRDRAEAAARMVAADLRRERLHAQHAATHRRAADNTRETTP